MIFPYFQSKFSFFFTPGISSQPLFVLYHHPPSLCPRSSIGCSQGACPDKLACAPVGDEGNVPAHARLPVVDFRVNLLVANNCVQGCVCAGTLKILI